MFATGPSALPHSGQNIAGSRIDAPHDAQRSEVLGCIVNFEIRNSNFLDPMHGIEKVFALSINVHAKFFTFRTESFL